MVNEHWLQAKSPAALAPNKRISQFFDSLKPGIDFSPAMKLLDSIFFQQKTFVCIENLLFRVAIKNIHDLWEEVKTPILK